MKVIIVQAFTGYPEDPKGPSRDFVPGPDPVEVPDDFGALIVKKGHAKAATDDGAEADAPAGAAPAEASHEAE